MNIMFHKYKILYFVGGATISSTISVIISYNNILWDRTSTPGGIIFLVLQGLCSFFVSELFLQYLLLFYRNNTNSNTNTNTNTNTNRDDKGRVLIRNLSSGYSSSPSYIINYNLKATTKEEVDTCFENMYETIIGNLTPGCVSILISVSVEPDLRDYETEKYDEYRKRYFNYLYRTGLKYLRKSSTNTIIASQPSCGKKSVSFAKNNHSFWREVEKTDHLDEEDLISICKKYYNKFLFLRRDCAILRKCGQYQDLIIATQGYDTGYTYSDYRDPERPFDDIFTIVNPINSTTDTRITDIVRGIEYTAVLDLDTVVPKRGLINLIQIARANPVKHSIYQPKIELYKNDTVFQHYQAECQKNTADVVTSVCRFIGHSPFFGKGLIHNKSYFDKIIGPPSGKREVVPPDALSHDVFEAMATRVMYVPNVIFREQLPKTYIAWNYRELRWCMGEIIFFKHVITCAHHNYWQYLTFERGFISLSACRVIFMKPVLMAYIISILSVEFRQDKGWDAGLMYNLSIVIILPNLLLLAYSNNTKITVPGLVKTVIYSIIHNTPEPLLGTLRIIISLYKIYCGRVLWTSSGTIDNQLDGQNTVLSIYYFGWLSLLAGFGLIFIERKSIFLFFLSSITVLCAYSIVSGVPILYLQNMHTIKNMNIFKKSYKIGRIGIRKSSIRENNNNMIKIDIANMVSQSGEISSA